MADKKKRPDHIQERFLTKTQEVHYHKDFKRANRVYQSIVEERNRS